MISKKREDTQETIFKLVASTLIIIGSAQRHRLCGGNEKDRGTLGQKGDLLTPLHFEEYYKPSTVIHYNEPR